MNTFVYEIGPALYINLTNRCTNKCSFCVRNGCSGVGGHELWLDREPSAREVLDSIPDFLHYQEIVFCGFGEPMIRIGEIIAISKELKKKCVSIRINTNGQANLYHGYNVVPGLNGLVDTISISLNAATAERYQQLCQSDFGESSFQGVLDFTAECAKMVPEVVLSVVDVLPPEEIERCRQLAENLGVTFRIRTPY